MVFNDCALASFFRYHESQMSEADWHLHSIHDPEEVQVDPRALSDVTDEEVVQVRLNINRLSNILILVLS